MEIWKKENLRVESLTGAEAKKYFEELARLRIEIFREYPYLYDGTPDYEKPYLERYFKSGHSRILLVLDGEKVRGMATYIPMSCEEDEIKAPFVKLKLDISRYLYIGEFILEPQCRGKKIFNVFMDYAQALLKELSLEKLAIMTIKTSPNDRLRPKNYQSVNVLYRRLGFQKIENSEVEFTYKSSATGQTQPHTMYFWQR